MITAIIGLNNFAPGYSNGWHRRGGNKTFLLQNNNNKGLEMLIQELKHQPTKISEFDKIIFFVTSDLFIRLVSEAGLDPKKAVFVFCDCNESRKLKIINDLGFSSSKIIDCECGGRHTMFGLFYSALNF